MYNFKLDVVFKFVFAQPHISDSLYLLHILVESVVGRKIGKVIILNSEIIALDSYDKTVRYDIKIQDEDLNLIDIEMQNTSLSQTQLKRFGYYGAKLIDGSIHKGDDYELLQQNAQIILVDEKHGDSLIESYIPRTREGVIEGHHIEMNEEDSLLVRHYIYLPYINEILKTKKLRDFNDFELMIYIIHNGVDEKVKKIRRKVVRVMNSLLEVFNHDPVMSDIAFNRRIALMTEKAEQHEFMERGKAEGIVKTLELIIMNKYHKDASSWLKTCSNEELTKVTELLGTEISYEDLLKRI